MAEIRVAPTKRRGLGWLWLLLLLVIVAAVVYWLYTSGTLGGANRTADTVQGTTTALAVPPPSGSGN